MVDTSSSVSNFLARRHSAGDVSNTLILPPYPSVPDHICREFTAPEGTYTQHHTIFVNSMQPLYTVGTSVSLVAIKYKENNQQNNLSRYEAQPGARSFRRIFGESEEEVKTPSLSSSSSSHTTTMIPEETIPQQNSPTPTSTLSFLARNHTLGRNTKKPKTNITKTNSSFVQRIITNDQLAKILMARTSEDTNLFYNCGTSFVWMDAGGHPKEPLSRIVFARACPTSHDVNLLTRGADQLDVIIGFSSGDIMWFDPLCNKYGRINKGGVMNNSSITMIKWLQGYENLFMAAFNNGSVMIFDKEKEDELFHPGDDQRPSMTPLPTSFNSKTRFKITKPPQKIASKNNPVSHWKLSNQSITAFAFSPDCQHVAIVGLDGLLRVVNFLQETLCDVYEAYYGGLTCVSWSPDGRYILTGGQDDLVTIWAFREQRIIARCQGHSSWITHIAFDPWRCDEKLYRFASVGEDGKLILWDFSVNALHKPKSKSGNRNRGTSVSSVNGPPLNGIIATMQDNRHPIVHPVQSKTDVAFLQPTMVKAIHGDPCVGVYFREDVIVTTDKRGKINLWKRPAVSSLNT